MIDWDAVHQWMDDEADGYILLPATRQDKELTICIEDAYGQQALGFVKVTDTEEDVIHLINSMIADYF